MSVLLCGWSYLQRYINVVVAMFRPEGPYIVDTMWFTFNVSYILCGKCCKMYFDEKIYNIIQQLFNKLCNIQFTGNRV